MQTPVPIILFKEKALQNGQKLNRDDPSRVIKSLSTFFKSWNQLCHDEPARESPFASLQQFLRRLQALNASVPITPIVVPPRQDPAQLESFYRTLRLIYDRLESRGEFINVWSVAGLKRDEIRHAAVLAWFLDPNGTHGFKNAIFTSWISSLPQFASLYAQVAAALHQNYTVAREVYPAADGENRVDIEISSEFFYICIEVKIDADEGLDQLKRYLEISATKAGKRPSALVFLSREIPRTTSTEPGSVVLTTWSEFSRAVFKGMSCQLQTKASFSIELLLQFLKQVRRL
jgi:hypothetical protein